MDVLGTHCSFETVCSISSALICAGAHLAAARAKSPINNAAICNVSDGAAK